jgi:hypothetical protein
MAGASGGTMHHDSDKHTDGQVNGYSEATAAAAVSSQDEVVTGVTDSIFLKDDEPCDIWL